jgi:parallel beta-helix repeat protein
MESKRVIKMKKVTLLIITSILISPIVYINIDNVLADSYTYYVANAGSDSNNGLSPITPWKTIGKVNTAMNAGTINTGDDIYFKRGDTFTDTYLNIKTGGSSINEMIIGSYGSGAKPVFNNTGTYSILLNINGLQYITIKNLTLKNVTAVALCALSNLSNITVSHVDIMDCGKTGIFFDDTIGLKIENCIVRDCVQVNICLYGDPYHRLSNVQILNCTTYNSDTKDLITLHKDDVNNDAGSNFLFRNCTGYNSGEFGFDISAGKNIVLEDCETYGNVDGGMVFGHDLSNVTVQNCYIHDDNLGLYIGDGNNFILRNNIVFNIASAPLTFYPTIDGGGYAGEDGWIENCNVYNNVFCQPSVYSGANRIVGVNHDFFIDVYLKNNIFVTFNKTTPDRLYRVYSAIIPPNSDFTFDSNMWWHGSGSSTSKWWNGSAVMSLNRWHDYYPNDKFDNPEFADVENADFTLHSTSPCIDNGTWLTQTAGVSTGTVVTVDDASYFTDGYGIIGGDIIFVGDNINLKITEINYNNNQITVNRSITWTNGEAVSLQSYSGSKPDIGAYEYIGYTGPLITNIFLTSSNPLDTDPSYGWINITCTVTDNFEVQQVKLNITKPNETFSNVTMNFLTANTYYLNSSIIFSDHGNYNYYIWVRDTNQNTKNSNHYNLSIAPNWDINLDEQITILDCVLISNSYSESGPNGWIREDTNNDGNINVIDLVTVSNHYGET